MSALRVPLLPAVARWLGVAAVAAVIVAASVAQTGPPGPETVLDVAISYLYHFAAYAGLGVTLAYALVDTDVSHRRRAVLVVLVAVGFGIAVELVQGTLAHRTASVLDAVVNAAGAVLALAWYALERRCEFVPLGEWR